jgi:4-alpha-glucanotransferase
MSRARLPVFDRRRAGALLPLSALEAPLGCGGRAFIDWLAAAGFSVWQILPVGPAGGDGSPYWLSSDHAGDPALLDPGQAPAATAPPPEFLAESSSWLPDFALFTALTAAHAGAPFWQWPVPLRDREPLALARARIDLAAECARIEREQYAFKIQWQGLREYAQLRGVRLFGDLPFYVAPSSAEVWAHRRLFQVTASGEPAAVAGCAAGLCRGAGATVGQSALRLAGDAA